MVTHGRILTENNPAPSNDPVRTGNIHHTIKAMLASPPQELSRPLAGRGGITPPTSNLLSYSSSTPTKRMRRATSQVNQTTFARFDRLSRASPSPKWMTCSKIPHHEREHVTSPVLGQQSSCLASPTADNNIEGGNTFQSTFSSRIISASIALREKNTANNNGTAIASKAPQCNLKPTDLQGSKALADEDDNLVMEKKSDRTEMERREGVVEVVEPKEVKENKQEQDRAVEASSSTKTGRGKDPPENMMGNNDPQKQDGKVVVEATNRTLGDENVDNHQSEGGYANATVEFSSEEEPKEKKNRCTIAVIGQRDKGKDTVVVDNNNQTVKGGMEENDSSKFKTGVDSSTPLEENPERSQRKSNSSSSDVSKIEIYSDRNKNNDTAETTLLDQEVEFVATEIKSRESSPYSTHRRASLRSSAAAPPCIFLSAQQAQTKTTLPRQHGLGKVILSANKGEVVLRDWFIIGASDEKENSSTQEPIFNNSSSSPRRKEMKYCLCGDLETYQSNSNFPLPLVTSGVIHSRQAHNLVITEDGDIYRLEGECCAARDGTDSNSGIWTNSAREAFQRGFPIYWKSTLRHLQNQGTAADADAHLHDIKTIRTMKLPPAAQSAVPNDDKEEKEDKKPQYPLRQLRPRRQQSSPHQEIGRGQPLKRKLAKNTRRSPNPTEQKKTNQSHPSLGHHDIVVSGSSVVEQKKKQLRSSPRLHCKACPRPPATKRSSPSSCISSNNSSSSIKGHVIMKQVHPSSMPRKMKMEMSPAARNQPRKSKLKPSPSIKKKTLRSATPQRDHVRKTRSGRHVFSSLEWWKGERLMSTRPGLQGSPVVIVGRGEIQEDNTVKKNSKLKELKKGKFPPPILIMTKDKSINGCVNKRGRGGGGMKISTTTRIGSSSSITKPAGGNSQSSSKQYHKNMTVSSGPRRKLKDDVEMNIKVAVTAPHTGMKMMTCQNQKKSSAQQQEMGIQQTSDNPDCGNWTEDQMKALRQANLSISPAARNYWGRVAEAVPGKTASECQAKHYEPVISSKSDLQCTTTCKNTSTNVKKRKKRPTAREKFTRYLQKATSNVDDTPSTALGEMSKVDGDDLFEDSQMRMAKKGIKLPQSAGFAAVQVERKDVSGAPVSQPLLEMSSSDPGVTRKYMTQLAKAVRGRGGGISSRSGLPPSKAISPAADTITSTTGTKRELAAAVKKKKARQLESEFLSLLPIEEGDSDEAPVIRIGGSVVSSEDGLDESALDEEDEA